MSEPITKTIPLSELESWLDHIRSVMPPSIPYGTKEEMLQAAYDARGDALYLLNHRIATFIR